MEYRHGEILPRAALCIICMCYYGEVVCSSEKCPPLKIGCRRINTEKRCCGKIVCGICTPLCHDIISLSMEKLNYSARWFLKIYENIFKRLLHAVVV